MKKQDMKIGMHVGVGYVERRRRGRPQPATEAYILVLPVGRPRDVGLYRRSQAKSPAGKVGLAVLSRDGQRWEPQWRPSVEVLHQDWDAHVAEAIRCQEESDRRRAEIEKRRLAKKTREGALSERLKTVGLTLTHFYSYRGRAIDLDGAETLLALLDEARGVAETMRREWAKHYPTSQQIALPWEIDVTDEDEPLTGATT